MFSPLTLTLLITALAAIVLISGKVRPDLVGLLVTLSLALTGILPLKSALAGFSSNVVFVLLAIFILTKGLETTGVTAWLGKRLARLGGGSEARLVGVTMLASALLSLFMNTVAAAAVLLPPVLAITRRRRDVTPSRVLIPLAYGTLLGGTATLLTTANLVTSASLEAHGLKPYGLLDFLPVGLPVTVAGLIFMLLVGRRLLPRYPLPGPLEIVLTPGERLAVEGREEKTPGWRGGGAIALLLTALLPAALGWAPLALTTLAAATLMMLIGIVPPSQAYRVIPWQVLFLIGGMIPLGVAMRQTGAAAFLSRQMLLPLANAPGWGIAAAFLLLTALLAQVTSGQVAALLLAPLAIAAAESYGLPPRGLGMAVAVGASFAFLLPTGHPVNLLVMQPGRYKPADYFKVGLPLLVVVAPVAVVGLQWFWLR